MIRNLTFSFVVCVALATSWLHAQSDSGKKPRWLLVTTAELAKELEPLVLRRQQQGFEVFKVIRDDQLPNNDWNAEFIRNKISEIHVPNHATQVLLAGDWNESNKLSFVPPGKGKQGRMQNAPTDLSYGLLNERGVPSVAVGRFPARTADDVRQFVAKVIRYEDQSIGPWTNRLNLWVGHPGGNSGLEKKLGETIIQSAVNKSLSQLNLAWKGSCLIDFPNTPYSVDRATFGERMRNDLSQGQSFTIYAGHSAAEGIWSEDQFVFGREEWERTKIQTSPGVVLTTGCFSCQMAGPNGKGFLTASVLNPEGPVAGLGAYAESYAAHGQLAMDAFVNLVARPKPPSLLGDYWLAIAEGLGRGKMDPLTFLLYDQADGSRGAIPLDKQRLEHLEMWTLLGDPALKMPFLEPTLDVDVKAQIGSSEVVIEFDVPEMFFGGTCELQIQFRPKTGTQVSQPIVSTQQLEAKPRHSATVPGFKPLAEGTLNVRVFAFKHGHGVLGIASVSPK
jgi:Peptidase family C25